MLNVAFCDDDRNFLHNVEKEAKKIFETLKVKTSIDLFTDANLLIEKFEQYNPHYHIIFLDIDMPLNGKEVARKLRLIDHQFKLVFITSFEQEVLNTFQFNVSDFLPKQLLKKRLLSVIQRVVNAVNEENPQNQIFEVNRKDDDITTIKVPLNDIMYIESVNRKSYLHTKRETYLLHGYKFTELATHYINFNFVDIHRICIVNIKYIYSIGETEVQLDNGRILPLSRRKRQNVVDKFIENICEVNLC